MSCDSNKNAYFVLLAASTASCDIERSVHHVVASRHQHPGHGQAGTARTISTSAGDWVDLKILVIGNNLMGELPTVVGNMNSGYFVDVI